MGLPTRRSRRPEPRPSDELRLASYPPPYPDGWYRLLGSKSLRRGQVRYLECLGRALVVWRSEDADDVFAMAAFCPHLGANLGLGRVCKDRIQCAFHAWQFTGDGRVASVPYSDTAPTRVLTESFPVQEVHGQIFMYHRGGGAKQQAGEEVPYPVPRIPDVDDGSFSFRGHYDAGRINMHMIELIENAADPAHFSYLHNRMSVPWTQIPVPGVELEHTALLDLGDDREPHRMPVLIETVLKVLGRRIERTRSKTRVTYTGAGSILNLRISIPGAGRGGDRPNPSAGRATRAAGRFSLVRRSEGSATSGLVCGRQLDLPMAQRCPYLARQGVHGATESLPRRRARDASAELVSAVLSQLDTQPPII